MFLFIPLTLERGNDYKQTESRKVFWYITFKPSTVAAPVTGWTCTTCPQGLVVKDGLKPTYNFLHLKIL